LRQFTLFKLLFIKLAFFLGLASLESTLFKRRWMMSYPTNQN